MGPNDGRSLTRFRRIKLDLTILLLVTISVTAASDAVFSEGGGPYPLEEEILEELARESAETRREDTRIGGGKTDAKDIAGISSAGLPQPKPADVFNPPPPYAAHPATPSIPKSPPVLRPRPTASPIISPESAVQNRPQPPPVPAYNVANQEYEKLKSAAEAAIMKQTSMLQEQQKPTIQKKEGQQEYPTFVEPIPEPAQNRRLHAEKLTHDYAGHEEMKRAQSHAGKTDEGSDLGDTVFIAVVAVCSVVGILGFSAAGYTFYSLHKQYKAAQEVEYPHYGVTGPAKERTSGSTSPVAAMDAKLASSAQLYHYQHTKQQIIAMENSTSDAKGQDSEDSEGEGEEGDFSVYECPGLAPTGDIEVSNPLFENIASPHAKVDPKKPSGDTEQE